MPRFLLNLLPAPESLNQTLALYFSLVRSTFVQWFNWLLLSLLKFCAACNLGDCVPTPVHFLKGNHKHFHISEAILAVGSVRPLTLKPTMRAIFTILTACRTVATMCCRTHDCGNNLGVVKRSMATMWAIFTIWCHF